MVYFGAKRLLMAALVAVSVGASQGDEAAPILGAQLFYTGGDVTVESLPVSSGFTSELGLYDPSFTRLVHLMNDEPPGVVVTFNPGTLGIGVGDELIFGIRIVGPGTQYFMGPASRNPDGIMHATVDDQGAGVFVVGFEDLFGGGDRDFDDNKFRVTGAGATTPSAPEPASVSLLALGLVPLARRRFFRSK